MDFSDFDDCYIVIFLVCNESALYIALLVY